MTRRRRQCIPVSDETSEEARELWQQQANLCGSLIQFVRGRLLPHSWRGRPLWLLEIDGDVDTIAQRACLAPCWESWS